MNIETAIVESGKEGVTAKNLPDGTCFRFKDYRDQRDPDCYGVCIKTRLGAVVLSSGFIWQHSKLSDEVTILEPKNPFEFTVVED